MPVGGEPDVLYSVFISYNHRDRGWAAWLHRELERYRVPTALIGRPSPVGPLGRRLPPVFQDREELAASSDLAQSVRKALAQSANLIVICSTSAARSRWVNEEVRAFSELGRRDRIQCLIVPESDPRDERPASEILPPALLEGGEPLAADARRSGDGKRAALLKLVASVIDVRFDELRQREHAKRQKRLMQLAAAAVAGFILMSGLAAFALISRAEAVHQRDVAQQKTITAERTTDFVKSLFQVSDPSEAKGESITAREVLDRGARQIEGELNDEPDVKAELVSTLSEVYMGLGSYRRADDLIRRSIALPVRNPDTRARQLAVMASSQSLQGNYEQAVDIFARAQRSLQRPDRDGDPALYSRILVGRAEALAALEKYPEAKALIAEALASDRKVEGPRGQSVARDLEAAGLTTQFAGDLDAARTYYNQALAIRLTQGRLHPKVSDDLNNLGTVAYQQRDPAAAEGYWRQSLALDEQVLGANHPEVATTLNNLARVLLEQRKFRDALPLLTRSANINLAQRSDTHDDLSFIFSNLALAKRGVGDDEAAEQLFNKALEAAQVHKNRMRAPILVDFADLRCARGNYTGAMQMLARAAPIMKADYPDDPWRSAWVDNTRGACLFRQGDRGAARKLIQTTSKSVLERWPRDSLYGAEVEGRLASVGLHRTP
jgi:tetratricopeptide (TPR) repeat protein